jgi:hypothetical protein
MADRVLFVGWGSVARGREQRALESFNEAVGYYGVLQQDARIERFDLVLLNPNGFLNGFALLHCSQPQLDAVLQDDRFLRLTAGASLIVDDLRLLSGVTGEGIAEALGRYQDAIAQLSARATA